jgi:hypothetical protein
MQILDETMKFSYNHAAQKEQYCTVVDMAVLFQGVKMSS